MNWASNSSLTGYLILAADLFLRLGFSARIIRRRLPAGVAWAWLSIIMFLPLFGTLIYLNFGEYRQTKRRRRRLAQTSEKIRRIADSHPLPAGETKLQRAFRELLGLPAVNGNDIELLKDSPAAFARLIEDIRTARSSIDLEFYIWSDGGVADEFADALTEAAKRGVRCRLLVDAIGSAHFIKGKNLKMLKNAGVHAVVALPSGFWRSLFARADLRIHRKIVIIDGNKGYTGSMNLADPRFFNADSGVAPWVDAFAKVTGPAVRALYGVFLSDWCAETGDEFASPATLEDLAVKKSAAIQCLPSGPAIKDSAIEQALIMSINSAQHELILTTPYFIPSEAFLYALIGAARRGVQTTLIVPEQVDSRLTHYASRSFFEDLITAGVVVALFKGGLLHTKSVTIDGELSLFGSLNLDPRSLRINFEISIAVFDPEFTGHLRGLQLEYLRESLLYTSADVLRQTRGEIWKGDIARLLGPIL